MGRKNEPASEQKQEKRSASGERWKQANEDLFRSNPGEAIVELEEDSYESSSDDGGGE